MRELQELQELQELKDEIANVFDGADDDESEIQEQYSVTSYGADFDVDGLVRRIIKGDIFIPPFQREFVWNMNDASRFIESLLLGLPVPGIFLAKESDSNKLLVIDGQQRLKTLQFFYDGYFNPIAGQTVDRKFKLSNVHKKFNGLTYKDLGEPDRIKLDDSIIHATIVKQDSPEDEDTSIYHIFERLNAGGRKLVAQEMRTALFHGKLIDMLSNLNTNPSWRSIFRKTSNRLKDQELILRFFSLYFAWEKYTKPMSNFITKFAKVNRNPNKEFIAKCETVFNTTIDLIHNELGDKAFRPERVLNAGVFDSVMVGVANRLESKKPFDATKLKTIYNNLLGEEKFNGMVSISTSDTINVKGRIKRSIEVFSEL